MPCIVEFPHMVLEAQEFFAELFRSEPLRRHFAEYLTGLLIVERKSVLGIHDEFAELTDHSFQNRFLAKVDWDDQTLNGQRLQ